MKVRGVKSGSHGKSRGCRKVESARGTAKRRAARSALKAYLQAAGLAPLRSPGRPNKQDLQYSSPETIAERPAAQPLSPASALAIAQREAADASAKSEIRGRALERESRSNCCLSRKLELAFSVMSSDQIAKVNIQIREDTVANLTLCCAP